MANYQNSKIYRLVCNTTGLCYIGSTVQKHLTSRLWVHKNDHELWLQGKKKTKCSSTRIIENYNYDIVLIEDFPCNNKEELHKRERHFIESTDCVNIIIPTRTKAEWNHDNPDKVAAQRENKKLRENAKSLIKKEAKEKLYEELGTTDRHKNNAEQTKTYNKNNPEKAKAQNKKASEKEPILCTCGKHYSYKHKARHMESKFHTDST